MSGRGFTRGLWIAAGSLLLVALAFIARMLVAFDGKCGVVFRGMSERRACSFAEYASGEVAVLAMLMVLTFWPLVLAVLMAPPLVGLLLDRRR